MHQISNFSSYFPAHVFVYRAIHNMKIMITNVIIFVKHGPLLYLNYNLYVAKMMKWDGPLYKTAETEVMWLVMLNKDTCWSMAASAQHRPSPAMITYLFKWNIPEGTLNSNQTDNESITVTVIKWYWWKKITKKKIAHKMFDVSIYLSIIIFSGNLLSISFIQIQHLEKFPDYFLY